MKTFAIVVNSTTDENAAYYEENDIQYAALAFTMDGKTIKEDCGKTMPFEDFYNHLRVGRVSTTSQAQVEDYLTYFRQACEAGRDVLYAGFSSGLSGSFDAGCMAAKVVRDEYPDRVIRCVDTLSATGGEVILVEEARRMRDAGHTADEAGDAIEALRLRVNHIVTVDDLQHLWRGGRVSRSAALVGGLIGIKPMIYVNDLGKLEVSSKIRGRKKAIARLAEFTAQEITDRSIPVRICHGDSLEDAKHLADLLAAEGLMSEIRVLGTVLGSHTGPGVLAAFFVGSERKPL